MGNLKQQGYRLMAHKGSSQALWVDPAEVPARCPLHLGWIDCTDFTDAQVEAFVMEAEACAT